MPATAMPAAATGPSECLPRHGNHADRDQARSRPDPSQSAASGADINVLSHDRLSCQFSGAVCRTIPGWAVPI
jgi:hypothetical protein